MNTQQLFSLYCSLLIYLKGRLWWDPSGWSRKKLWPWWHKKKNTLVIYRCRWGQENTSSSVGEHMQDGKESYNQYPHLLRQREESLQCLSIVHWLLINTSGGKLLLVLSSFSTGHVPQPIHESLRSGLHFSALVSRSSIAKKLKVYTIMSKLYRIPSAK